jgi:hypothetical protein
MRIHVIQLVQWVLDRVIRLTPTKKVLFVVHNEIMFQCAHEIALALGSDSRVKLWYCFVPPDRLAVWSRLKKQYRIRTVSHRWARKIKWDLIVFPDHSGTFRPECVKIYAGHGIEGGKLVKGTTYVFGPRSMDAAGNYTYQKIFCSSEYIRAQVGAAHPEFSPLVRVVGSLLADRLGQHEPNREERFAAMNLDADRKTVFICSTWGPDSLIQAAGESLVREIDRLGADHNIILSLHYLNYVGSRHDRVNVHDLLSRIQAKHFYLTRPDEEGGIFFLPLADILVTDTTSLGLYFPRYARPIIFYDIPGVQLDPVGLAAELRRASYVIRDISGLERHIASCEEKFQPEAMRELSSRIVSYQGRAAERHKQEIYDSLGLGPGA